MLNLLDDASANGTMHGVAKRMMGENRNVVGSGRIKDKGGNIVVESDKVREVWREYYDRLLNEEFPWNESNLDARDAVNGPAEYISCE